MAFCVVSSYAFLKIHRDAKNATKNKAFESLNRFQRPYFYLYRINKDYASNF